MAAYTVLSSGSYPSRRITLHVGHRRQEHVCLQGSDRDHQGRGHQKANDHQAWPGQRVDVEHVAVLRALAHTVAITIQVGHGVQRGAGQTNMVAKMVAFMQPSLQPSDSTTQSEWPVTECRRRQEQPFGPNTGLLRLPPLVKVKAATTLFGIIGTTIGEFECFDMNRLYSASAQ